MKLSELLADFEKNFPPHIFQVFQVMLIEENYLISARIIGTQTIGDFGMVDGEWKCQMTNV
jgi:hypothetical protein